MRLIIAGSRTLSPTVEDIASTLSQLEWSPTMIISGTARGADQAGEAYAEHHHLPIERYPADWTQYGKSAGYIRNKMMVSRADAVLLFWDGFSKGTDSTHRLARDRRIPVAIVRPAKP